MPSHQEIIVKALRFAAGISFLGAVACGGPISFVDDRPIAVVGARPAEPPKPQRVEVKQDRIQINEKILFDYDKATIRPESEGLLEEIRSVIAANGHIKKISIEGHTDGDGSENYNQKLSEQRAAAVMTHLVGKGIPAEKLTSAGFGKSRPIASNDSPDGKEKNRRVEFVIVEQDEVTKVFQVDPTSGERREVTNATAEANK